MTDFTLPFFTLCFFFGCYSCSKNIKKTQQKEFFSCLCFGWRFKCCRGQGAGSGDEWCPSIWKRAPADPAAQPPSPHCPCSPTPSQASLSLFPFPKFFAASSDSPLSMCCLPHPHFSHPSCSLSFLSFCSLLSCILS